MDAMQVWQIVKLLIGIMAGIIGLYHFIKLNKNNDAAYHAGMAIMMTMISYNLMEV